MEHIGVCVIVVNNKNQILLGKRKNSFRSGMFGLPGGRLELEEMLDICAKRELQEETTILANRLEYLGVIRELQEKEYNFIHFVFACTEFSGTPKVAEPEKCEDWNWYSLDVLPRPILPGHKAAIDVYLHPQSRRVRDLV